VAENPNPASVGLLMRHGSRLTTLGMTKEDP